MSDHLTILTTRDDKRMAKVARRTPSGWDVQGYEAGMEFIASRFSVAGLDDIERALWRLAEDRHSCVIRGELRDSARAGIVNRCQHPQADGRHPDWDHARPGRRWVAFDIDKMPIAERVDSITPEWLDSLAASARDRLPEPFRSSGCVYKLSSRAGLDGWRTLSLHLWFWLRRPVYDLSWRRWSKGVDVDASMFSAVQPHYTADPIFEGASDHLAGCRIGRLPGPEVVAVPPELTDAAGWTAAHEADLAARKGELDAALAGIVGGFAQSSTATRRYALQTLSGCVSDMLSAGEGARHGTLVTKAYKLGGYVQDGFLDEREVMGALEQAITAIFEPSRYKEELRTAGEMLAAGMTSPLDLAHIGRGAARPKLSIVPPAPDIEEGSAARDLDPWERVEQLKRVAADAKTAAAKKAAAKAVAKASREVLTATGKAPLFSGVRDDGKVPSSGHNIKALFDFYGFKIRRNAMLRDTEITVPETMGGAALGANGMLAAIYCRAYDQGMTVDKRFEHELTLLERQNTYHPVADWIRSVPWDGVDRFEDLWRTVRLREEAMPHEALYRAMLRAWMVTGAKMAMLPLDAASSVEAHGVLVLQGQQGCGKTKWLSKLVPEDLEFVSTGVHLDPAHKDSVDAATRYWLVELGEIDSTLRRSDIAMLKAFLTNSRDQYRSSYERKVEKHLRRTFFAASVNEVNFLKDTTGNRRFWTMPVAGLLWRDDDPFRVGDIDRQQLWAQFAALAEAGASHVLTRAEEAELGALNEAHRQIDPLEDEIRSKFTLTADGIARTGLLTADIYQTLYPAKELDRWTSSEKMAVARALTAFGAESFRTSGGRRWTVQRS